MRPYLAIIIDSFRAAIANRLLIVLAIIITIFLLALAPLTFKESVEYRLLFNPGAQSGNQVPRPNALVKYTVDNLENPQVAKFASYIEPADLERIKEEPNPDSDGVHEQIERSAIVVSAIATAIEDENFFDEKVWDLGKMANQELAEINKRGVENLNSDEKKRLTRILASTTFPGLITLPQKSSVTVKYAKWKLMESYSGMELYRSKVTSFLPYLMDKFVLSIGLLIAVLVTAPLMPNMFDPGSLSLLLSKPISRWGLYLAKFAGGCAFIALLATYLFVGVWLLLGLRLGLWDRSILLSIPIYVIVFAIYFSVSAFIGMYFKNTIIAVVMTALFWGVCFAGGTIFKMFNSVNNKTKIAHVVNTKEETLQLNRIGAPSKWNAGEKQWDDATADQAEQQNYIANYSLSFFPFIPENGLPSTDTGLKAIYCPKYNFVIGGARLVFADQNSILAEPRIFYSNLDKGYYSPKVLGNLRGNGAKFLIRPDGDLVLVTAFGQFKKLAGDPEDFIKKPISFDIDPNAKNKDAADQGNGQQQKGPKSNRPGEIAQAPQLVDFNKLFVKVGPDRPMSVADHHLVDMNQSTGEIAIYGRKRINIYKEEDGKYKLHRTAKIDVPFDSTMTAWLKYQKDHLFLAFGNGEISVLDGQSLKLKQSYLPEKKSAIHGITASKSGQYLAITYRNGNTWLLDTSQEDSIQKPSLRGQGDTSYASFDGDNQLWIADRTNRLTQYNPETLEQKDSINPKVKGFQWYYLWVRRMYRILPKPGEFYKLVTHLSSSSESKKDSNLDLTQLDEPSNPWEPFVSGVIFMSVMLGLACFVFQRADY